jgi:hypothetical protein
MAPAESPRSRAELKRQYKERAPPAGVWAVRNLRSGKVLLGASVNVPGMLNRLRFELESGLRRHPALQEDWDRLGPEAFAFETLDLLPAPKEGPVDAQVQREELKVLEALWLERLRPWGEAGYHARPAG